MSSEGSDNEELSTLPKKIAKKLPKGPSKEPLKNNQDEKKITTKDMINQALVDLKSRKGTSLYAIKKYIEEKYKVDVDKLNYIIKKSIKTSVESGSIVQTKGIGASGSFKLAPKKDKPQKKEKLKESIDKPTKSLKPQKTKATKDPKSDDSVKTKKKVVISKPTMSGEKKKKSKKEKESRSLNEAKIKKTNVTKTAKGFQTPTKKKSAMMKRKSIGSIIKPPKMNPRKE